MRLPGQIRESGIPDFTAASFFLKILMSFLDESKILDEVLVLTGALRVIFSNTVSVTFYFLLKPETHFN